MMKSSTFLTVITASIVIILCALYLNYYPGYKPSTSFVTPTNSLPTLSPSPLSPTPTIANWKIYTNPTFSFNYPQDYIVNPSYFAADQAIIVVGRDQKFSNTVLNTHSAFEVKSVASPKGEPSCYYSSFDGKKLSQSHIVNGQKYYFTQFSDAAAGTHSTTYEFRTFYKNVCYEVNLIHRESSDWNNPSDKSTADTDQITSRAVLDQILATFKFH